MASKKTNHDEKHVEVQDTTDMADAPEVVDAPSVTLEQPASPKAPGISLDLQQVMAAMQVNG